MVEWSSSNYHRKLIQIITIREMIISKVIMSFENYKTELNLSKYFVAFVPRLTMNDKSLDIFFKKRSIVEKINNLSLCFNLKRSLYFLMILYQGAKVYFIY